MYTLDPSTTATTTSALSNSVSPAISTFDEAITVSDTGTASLSGVVYDDINANGIRDSSDYGIFDATVTISLANSNTVLASAYTTSNGSYSFTNLTAGAYKVTLTTLSTNPSTPSIGSITDSQGHNVTTNIGTVSGVDTITEIAMNDGDTAKDYDFPQQAYPYQLLSKRMLLNTTPGIIHTPPGPPVPEPSSVLLLAIAGLFLSGLRCRRPV